MDVEEGVEVSGPSSHHALLAPGGLHTNTYVALRHPSYFFTLLVSDPPTTITPLFIIYIVLADGSCITILITILREYFFGGYSVVLYSKNNLKS